MKIVNVNTLRAYEELLNTLALITDKEDLGAYLMVNLGTDVFGAWFAVDEDNVVGVCVVEAVDLTLDPKMFMAYLWTDKDHTPEQLVEHADAWGRKRKLRKAVLYSNRNYKKYQNYGFSLKRTVMEKEL